MKKISQNAWIKMDGHRLRWKTWLFSCNFACNVQYIVWVYVIVVLIVNDCEGLVNKFSYCSVILVLSFKDACWMTITCQCWENKLWYTVNKVKLAIFTLYHKNLWQNKFTLCLVFEFWISKEYSVEKRKNEIASILIDKVPGICIVDFLPCYVQDCASIIFVTAFKHLCCLQYLIDTLLVM